MPNHRRKLAYNTEANELREHEGEWRVVEKRTVRGMADRREARQLATDIEEGNYEVFRPTGCFEAITEIQGDQAATIARYTGKHRKDDSDGMREVVQPEAGS